jgi:hypothetical protein
MLRSTAGGVWHYFTRGYHRPEGHDTISAIERLFPLAFSALPVCSAHYAPTSPLKQLTDISVENFLTNCSFVHYIFSTLTIP